MKRKQEIESVRWDLALRYRLIETVVWWEGRLTTNHLMQSFGISRQQASKDINTYINEHAPKNLEYDKHVKGYVPSKQFKPLFIDDSASAYLHLLNQNHDRAPHVEGLALAYAHTEVLQVPDRTVRPELLRPLLRACREGLRLECEYVSFTTPDAETRLIAPHTLIYNAAGAAWSWRPRRTRQSAAPAGPATEPRPASAGEPLTPVPAGRPPWFGETRGGLPATGSAPD